MKNRPIGAPALGRWPRPLLAGCASSAGIAAAGARCGPWPASACAAQSGAGHAPRRSCARWWQAFGDPQLDRLVEQALARQPDAARWRRPARPRAQAVQEAGRRRHLPAAAGLGSSVQRQRYTETGAVPAAAGRLGARHRHPAAGRQLGARFLRPLPRGAAGGAGQRARGRGRGAGGARAAGQPAWRAATSSWRASRPSCRWRSARWRSASRRSGLVRQRVDAGLDTTLELRQSEGALPEARQQIEALQEQAQLHAPRAGRAGRRQPEPAWLQPPALASLRAAARCPARMPADLLGRRADIAAARWRVEAATPRRDQRARRSSIPTSTWSPSSACPASA